MKLQGGGRGEREREKRQLRGVTGVGAEGWGRVSMLGWGGCPCLASMLAGRVPALPWKSVVRASSSLCPGSQTLTNDVGWVDSVFLPVRLSHNGVRKTARTVYLGQCAFY